MGRVASTEVELVFLGIGNMDPILSITGSLATKVQTRMINTKSQFARTGLSHFRANGSHSSSASLCQSLHVIMFHQWLGKEVRNYELQSVLLDHVGSADYNVL